MLRRFLTIHDPTIDRRDKGGQYRSAVFYTTDEQRQIIEHLFRHLKNRGYELSTEVRPAESFWPADERHQKYCEVRGFQARRTKGIPSEDLHW